MKQNALLTKALEKSNDDMDSFAYSISHDLRTPLRGMIGFSAILQKKFKAGLPEKAIEYLNIISDSALEMNQLINDLLTSSRTGRKPLEKQQVDVKDLVQKIIKNWVPVEDDSQIPLNFTVHDMPSCDADASLLKQLLIHLINNAVKFSKPNKPTRIEIGYLPSESAYYVKDNGIGLDMTFADRIFKVFQRLNSDQDFEGTGIGLAIAQKIINLHHGEIWVMLKQMRALVFTFR